MSLMGFDPWTSGSASTIFTDFFYAKNALKSSISVLLWFSGQNSTLPFINPFKCDSLIFLFFFFFVESKIVIQIFSRCLKSAGFCRIKKYDHLRIFTIIIFDSGLPNVIRRRTTAISDGKKKISKIIFFFIKVLTKNDFPIYYMFYDTKKIKLKFFSDTKI